MSAWTPEQQKFLKRYLKPKIDQVWGWWAPRQEARRRAVGSSGKVDTQICACCKEEFKKDETQVDHIDPTVAVDTRGFEDPGEYIRRKFVQVDALQILCKPCHKAKSNHENSARPHRLNGVPKKNAKKKTTNNK